VKITKGGRYTGILSNSASTPAGGVTVVDAGGYFSADDLEDILQEIGAGTSPDSFLTKVGGGVGYVQALGTLGATETIDLANANYFWGTLDQNCTITFVGFTNLRDCQIVVHLIENGTGGWTPTFTGVTWEGGTTPTHPTTAGTFTRYIFTSIDGGTTIIGNKIGAGGSSLTVEDQGTPLATAATTLDFVGPGITASGTGAEKTITVDIELAGHYELLMDGGSPPAPLEDGSGTDWLYTWVP
jgi:hypothetical protein